MNQMKVIPATREQALHEGYQQGVRMHCLRCGNVVQYWWSSRGRHVAVDPDDVQFILHSLTCQEKEQ